MQQNVRAAVLPRPAVERSAYVIKIRSIQKVDPRGVEGPEAPVMQEGVWNSLMRVHTFPHGKQGYGGRRHEDGKYD